MKRALAFTAFAGFVGGVCWMSWMAMRPDVFPAGAPLPPLSVRVDSDTIRLEPTGEELLILVFFHTDCPACLDELRMLEGGLEELQGADLYLLTDEENPGLDSFKVRWPRLAASPSVVWGVVEKEELSAVFDVGVTPTVIVFDGAGRQRARLVGARTASAILAESRGAGDPGTAPTRNKDCESCGASQSPGENP